MLTHDEELWEKHLPPAVEDLLSQAKDPLADRSDRCEEEGGREGGEGGGRVQGGREGGREGEREDVRIQYIQSSYLTLQLVQEPV